MLILEPNWVTNYSRLKIQFSQNRTGYYFWVFEIL